VKIRLSDHFYPLLSESSRYLVLCGGRGSGKSEFCARKLLFRCITEGGHRFLILRKVRKTCRQSVLEVMMRLLSENNIAYKHNKTEGNISFYGPDGKLNEMLFDGLDEPEKIKSIKGLTGVWIEEATEFRESEFVEVDLCLREPGPSYQQVMASFNPDETATGGMWLKRRFFDHIDPQAHVHKSTVLDNPIASIRADYLKQLNLLSDETLKKIYRYGMWAAPKGQIYDWDVVSYPGDDYPFDEIFYGGDFGYSVNPATVVRIYRRGDEFWLEEVVYQTGLINQDLGHLMRAGLVADDAPVYFDAAEPKSIEELSRMGFNVKPAEKGPDSVIAGIDFVKSKTVHILAGSENIIKEVARYCRQKDKDGNELPKPVKFDDHAMDAIRYGIATHCKRGPAGFAIFSQEAVY